MDILLGLGTLAVTALLLSFAYGAHRKAVPAKWTRLPGLSMMICVALTLMGPVGLGFLIKAALAPMAELASLSIFSVVITGVLVALAVMASPLLIRPALHKSGAYDDLSADNCNVAPTQETIVAA